MAVLLARWANLRLARRIESRWRQVRRRLNDRRRRLRYRHEDRRRRRRRYRRARRRCRRRRRWRRKGVHENGQNLRARRIRAGQDLHQQLVHRHGSERTLAGRRRDRTAGRRRDRRRRGVQRIETICRTCILDRCRKLKRAGTLQRTSTLKRAGTLQRTRALERTGALQRTSTLERAVVCPLPRYQPVSQSPAALASPWADRSGA